MKKILTVKLGSLGDVITFTPALEAIKKKYPKSIIDHLINKSCSKVLENDPLIDNIIKVNDLGSNNKVYDSFQMFLLFFRLCFKNYDEVYIFHRNKLLLLLFKIMRVKAIKIWDFEKEEVKGNIEYIKFDLKEHRIYRHLRMVNKKDYKEMDVKLRNFLYLSSEYNFKHEKYLVVSPGGGRNKWSEMKSRRMSVSSYLDLLQNIEFKKIVLIGGRDDKKECDYLEREMQNTNNKTIINLCGEIKLEDTAKLIKESSFFIGNDSMPLFLASAYKIPLLGFYCSTNGAVINPLNKESRYIQSKEECSPCYNPLKGSGKGKAYSCTDIFCTENKKFK